MFPIENRSNSQVTMIIRKRMRLLSVLLVGLAGAGLLIVGFGLTPLSGSVLSSMLGLGSKSDFSVTSDSSFVPVQQGATGTVSITLTSLDHFSGDIGITAGITSSANALAVTTSQSSVKLTSDQTASLSVTLTTTSSTTLGYYNITVQGKTSSLSHSITILAHITPPPPPPTPDFYLYSNPSSLTTMQGGSTSATLTVSSVLGFSGNVALTTSIYPSGTNSPTVYLNLTSLFLPSGGTNTTTVFVNTFNATGTSYTVLVTGTSGSLSHTISIMLSITISTSNESLYAEYAAVNSATNVTLGLRNLGSVTSHLVAYYVTDAQGDQYSLASWNGPTISPNAFGIATILIGASCSSCVLSGSSFTLTPGSTYGITVVTSYNHLFTYSLTLSGQESLALDVYSFNSTTVVALFVRNTGTIPVQLTSYYVRDPSGNTYSLVSFSGPTIAVNQVAAVSVAIGSSCPSCTLTGTAFTFTPGYSYSIIFVTARNNQFIFVVTR